MKIEVGKKYRMRDYPTKYLYVYILCKVTDIQPDCYDWQKNSFYGTIVEESRLISVKYCFSEIIEFGEKGSWDNAEAHGSWHDSNDLISEYQETNSL